MKHRITCAKVDFSTITQPTFLLDEAALRQNLILMQKVMIQAEVDIILAFKGFAMWSAFPLVRKYLKGATASSMNEVRLCYEEMDMRAHTYAVIYHPEEIRKMAAYSSHLTFNSFGQYEQYVDIFRKEYTTVSLGIRVNPMFSQVATDLYNPSKPGSRLGVTKAQFPSHLPPGIEGLHVHALCENDSQATAALIDEIEAQFGDYFKQLKWLNLGGGHLMTKHGYDVAHLIQVLKSLRKRHPHLQVILEPGSAVAWDTGVLVAHVMDIVTSSGIQTAVLDVSFAAHMPDTLEMPYRPSVRGAAESGEGAYQYRLGGTTCLSGDFMEVYGFDRPLKIGDPIIFEDMIHYTMVKTTTFNGVHHPDIAILREDETIEVVREFRYEDFKTRLS